MYRNMSDELKAAFNNFAPQKARVTVYSSGQMFVLASVDASGNDCLVVSKIDDYHNAVIADAGRIFTEKNMTIGGLSINRYCAADSELEFGNASSAEMTLVLNNSDEDINVDDFADAEMFVEVGCEGIDEWVPMGWFVVDEVRQSGTLVTVTCLDRMVYLDKPIDRSHFNEELTVWEILDYIAEDCGIPLSDDFEFEEYVINGEYLVHEFPTEYTITYRQLLVWIGQIMGAVTFFNRNGELDWVTLMEYAVPASINNISPSDRFSSEIASKPVTLTGLKIIDEDQEYTVGSEGYMIQFSNNGLMDHDFQDVLSAIWNGEGTVYAGLKNVRPWYPFSAEIIPMPYIDMLDGIYYNTKLGEHLFSYVTDWTFTLNANTLIACKGDTAVYKRQTISPYNSTGGVSTPAKSSAYIPKAMLQGRFTEVYVEARSSTVIEDVMPQSVIGNNPVYLATPWGAGHRCVISSIGPHTVPGYVKVALEVFNDNNTDDELSIDTLAIWF